MARFTKKLRQRIVEEFTVRHNGNFNPALFLDDVRMAGAEHPAYEWFEWDETKAAQAYRIEQARDFVRDLRVKFQIEEISRNKAVTVRETFMPLALSPVSSRRSGGGYYLVDTDDPEHMAEHCRQAASALRSWLARYQAAAVHAGISVSAFERTIKALEATAPQDVAEAA